MLGVACWLWSGTAIINHRHPPVHTQLKLDAHSQYHADHHLNAVLNPFVNPRPSIKPLLIMFDRPMFDRSTQ